MSDHAIEEDLSMGMRAATVASGAVDGLDARSLGAIGDSAASRSLSMVSGVLTAATHDAHMDSVPGELAERTLVGAADTAWGLVGGPLAVLDSATGGHAGGVMQAGANAPLQVADALINWDSSRLEGFNDGMLDGQYGRVVQEYAELGDAAGDGLWELVNGEDRSERVTDRDSQFYGWDVVPDQDPLGWLPEGPMREHARSVLGRG